MIRDRAFLYSIGFSISLAVAGSLAALQLPDDALLPIHWNANGEADGFASKWWAALMMPIVAAFLSVVMATPLQFTAMRKNMAHNMPIYLGVWMCEMVLFAFIQYTVFAGAFGWPDLMPNGIYIGIALIFGLLGNYLPKLKPSPIIGIRTPWTLGNDEIWIKTHRLGGRLMLAASAFVMISIVAGAGPRNILAVLLTSLLAAAIGPVLWSYILWQRLERAGR